MSYPVSIIGLENGVYLTKSCENFRKKAIIESLNETTTPKSNEISCFGSDNYFALDKLYYDTKKYHQTIRK